MLHVHSQCLWHQSTFMFNIIKKWTFMLGLFFTRWAKIWTAHFLWIFWLRWVFAILIKHFVRTSTQMTKVRLFLIFLSTSLFIDRWQFHDNAPEAQLHHPGEWKGTWARSWPKKSACICFCQGQALVVTRSDLTITDSSKCVLNVVLRTEWAWNACYMSSPAMLSVLKCNQNTCRYS